MNKIEKLYLEDLKNLVKEKISSDINERTISSVVKNDLTFHIQDKSSAGFQKYYFETLKNKQFFFESTDFFQKFKQQYSLQGIDKNYLNKLEKEKSHIYKLIQQDELSELYFKYFAQAKIQHGNKTIKKDLVSFFAKLVHTFRPEDYCALDNPIKNYFGLEKESFFIAFCIISQAYREWTRENKNLVKKIRQRLKKIDKQGILSNNEITDLKLLDLIFWKKANVEK